jgi:hypothetical protein
MNLGILGKLPVDSSSHSLEYEPDEKTGQYQDSGFV